MTACFTAMRCVGLATCGKGGVDQNKTQTARAAIAGEPRPRAGEFRESDSSVPKTGTPLQFVADIPLSGGPSRFDYQSLDAEAGRLYLAHMGTGQLVVVDVRQRRVLATIDGFPRVTGVLVVPRLRRIYASAAGAHRVTIVDASTFRVVAQVGGVSFPDELAYAPDELKVFVSDEFGRRELVIDAGTNRARGLIQLGGEAGNTQYDSAGRRILVAVQTRNQIVAIDPASDSIVGRYSLAGGDHPHGLLIDAGPRLAFVANEGNHQLLVVDLTSMEVIEKHPVGEDPDVLALDPGLQRLYVASESGVVTVFKQRDRSLEEAGTYYAPHAHSVAVDPGTHEVFLPLADVNGQPVLRIMRPSD